MLSRIFEIAAVFSYVRLQCGSEVSLSHSNATNLYFTELCTICMSVAKPQLFFIYVANDVLVRAAMKSAARCGKALRIALFSESIEASTCIVQPVSSGCSHDSVPGNSLLAAIPVQSLRGCGSIHVCVSAVCTLTYRCSMTQLHLFRVALVSMCGLVLAMRNPLACRL